MKAHGGRRGTAAPSPQLDAKWGWVVNATPQSLSLPRKIPGIYFTRFGVCASGSLGECGEQKIPYPH